MCCNSIMTFLQEIHQHVPYGYSGNGATQDCHQIRIWSVVSSPVSQSSASLLHHQILSDNELLHSILPRTLMIFSLIKPTGLDDHRVLQEIHFIALDIG